MKKDKNNEELQKENALIKIENEALRKENSILIAGSQLSVYAQNRMPAAICISMLQGCGVNESFSRKYSSPGLYKQLGYRMGEFEAMGDNCYPLMIHEKDFHCLAETVDFLKLNPGKSYRSMCRMVTSGGEVLVSIIISCRLSKKPDGSIDEILSVGLPLNGPIHNLEVLEDLIKAQKQLAHKDIVGKLTPRQKEVLALKVNGFTEKEIADKLFIGEETVKSHRKAIFKRLGVNNLQNLIRIAVPCGLN